MRPLVIFLFISLLSACSQFKTLPFQSELQESSKQHDVASDAALTSVDVLAKPPNTVMTKVNHKVIQPPFFSLKIVEDKKASSLRINDTPPQNAALAKQGVIDVLDFPFDPIENRLSEDSNLQDDYAVYGFFTPNDELETLINQELVSLRATQTPIEQLDLLDRIRNNFKLDLEQNNRRIHSQLSWFLRNPNYLTRTFNRASRYLYHVVNEVEKRGLPMELALLPFVESAYNPFAYSHGRASGLWQFIPGTGKIYGLEQDWWYDGRRDVLASTEAALNYLSYLNDLFDGNWLHALAAYNSGSGRVRSAIRKNLKRNKNTDFWSLDLPKETRAYVPKLIALSKVVLSPQEYQIEFPVVPDQPYFKKVDIGAQIDLAQAALMAEIDISEIYQLNPGFNQWASSPLGPHRLLIPIEKAALFKENLKSLPPEQRISWHRYSVKTGDSLIKIAKKFNTTPMLIKDINHLRSNLIKIKQKLLIPIASKASKYYNLSQDNRLHKKQATIQAKKGTDKISYKVKSGDTMWDLSRAHKVGVRELSRWNGMAPTDPIRPGQTLIIWSKKPGIYSSGKVNTTLYKKREMIQKVGYYVRKGDSLSRIANKFSVKIKDLITWNKLDRKKYLKPGQKLTIYVDITNS